MSTSRLHAQPLGQVRASRVPAVKPPARAEYTAVTGGRRVAAVTAGGLIVLVVVGLAPVASQLLG